MVTLTFHHLFVCLEYIFFSPSTRLFFIPSFMIDCNWQYVLPLLPLSCIFFDRIALDLLTLLILTTSAKDTDGLLIVFTPFSFTWAEALRELSISKIFHLHTRLSSWGFASIFIHSITLFHTPAKHTPLHAHYTGHITLLQSLWDSLYQIFTPLGQGAFIKTVFQCLPIKFMMSTRVYTYCNVGIHCKSLHRTPSFKQYWILQLSNMLMTYTYM